MRTLEPGRFAGTDPALVVSTPGGHVQQVVVAGRAELVAGRDPDLAISIPDESVSRRHAEFRGAPLAVRDLGSTNGTRVHGQPIGRGWTALDVGSVVELGDSVVLVRGTSAPAREVLVPPRRVGRGSEPPPTAARASAAASAPEAPGPEAPIAVAPATRHLLSLIELVAPSRLSVLVLGETGAGKEVAARALHAASDRRDRRLLTLNCAALPATLLESELFGHERGAFTGALAAKPGLFEAASGGTVFLDEIGELPLETQAKLLRVLESGEVLRIGALAPIAVDVRFVAATHKDLAGLAERGQFRLDLLFRIAGVTLEVPALRDRREDLAPLARAFLARARPAAGGFTAAALAALERHPWPDRKSVV
jgi:pSer/pThr/pTyr-binding forkhead associated (FHA) protein